MNRQRFALLAGLFGAGALTMYFFDPQKGRRRRTTVSDALVHSRHEIKRFGDRFRRDFENRMEGTLAEARGLFESSKASDYVLEQRVRTALGRTVSHPHALDVSCRNGSIFVSGWVLAKEADPLTKTLEGVRGGKEISTYLHTADEPGKIAALQGGRLRTRVPEFLQQRWSPTARVFAGAGGAGLLFTGLMRKGLVAKALSAGGLALISRAIANTPLMDIAGLESRTGLHIQKTLHVDATARELYDFWMNPENYSRVFSHVLEVTPEQEGVYRWLIAGPAGLRLSWEGRITRHVPDRLIEWNSLPGSGINNQGVVRLEPETDGRIRVHVRMSYYPPAGLLGHAFASLLGTAPKELMDEDFIRFKALFEQGQTKVRGKEVKKSDLKLAHSEAS